MKKENGQKFNIAVVGTGYVGMSLAVLLAQNNTVRAVDVIPEKVEKINKRISPISDEYIEKYLAEKDLDLAATLDAESIYKISDYIVFRPIMIPRRTSLIVRQ